MFPRETLTAPPERPLTMHLPSALQATQIAPVCPLTAGGARVVDAGAASLYKSAEKDSALHGFVGTVMGVPPSDPRAAGLFAILSKHDDAAIAAGATPTDALRSTFVVACSSPLSVSMGL